MEQLPEAWRSFLAGRYDAALLAQPLRRVEEERAAGTVFPPEGEVFRALRLTPPGEVRVVLLGQDPYHDDGQAQGLAFSVPAGFRRACGTSSKSTPPTSDDRFRNRVRSKDGRGEGCSCSTVC